MQNRASPAQMEQARRWLAHEGARGSAGERATAASRVYDRLHEHLAPLVGDAGVNLLFVRSAKLSLGEFAWLADVSILEAAPKLHERLRAEAPAVATESAAVLFGTFFALLTGFIGERLTTQVLRRAWPTIDDEAAPREPGQ